MSSETGASAGGGLELSGGVKSLCEACAGVTGAWVAILFTYPIELAKTRVQLQTKGISKSSYNGTLDALVTIFQRQGLEGSYRGVRGEITKEALKYFTSFYFYTQFKEMDRRRKENAPQKKSTVDDDSTAKHERKVDFWMGLLYGIASATITVFVTNPLNVAQVRVQARTKQDVDCEYSLFRTALHLVKTNGASSLWSGLGPSLLLVLNPALQLAVNDYLVLTYRRFKRSRIEQSRRRSVTEAIMAQRNGGGAYGSGNSKNGSRRMEGEIPEDDLKHELCVDKSEYYELSALEYFGIGAIAKGVSTVVTYPLILAKVLQSYRGDGSEREFKSAASAILSVIRSDGILGIYKGLQAQLTKSVLSAAILFMTKAQLEKLIWLPLFFFLLRLWRRKR